MVHGLKGQKLGMLLFVFGLVVRSRALFDGLFELSDTFSEALADLRKPVSPEKKQADKQNDQ